MTKKIFPTTKRQVEEVELDISDEACAEFGVKHEQILEVPEGDHNIMILGVGLNNEGTQNVIWYTHLFPRIEGKACYWGKGKNLFEAGFKKLPN